MKECLNCQSYNMWKAFYLWEADSWNSSIKFHGQFYFPTRKNIDIIIISPRETWLYQGQTARHCEVCHKSNNNHTQKSSRMQISPFHLCRPPERWLLHHGFDCTGDGGLTPERTQPQKSLPQARVGSGHSECLAVLPLRADGCTFNPGDTEAILGWGIHSGKPASWKESSGFF